MPRHQSREELPPRPRAALRIGFAGPRDLVDVAEQHLHQGLDRVLELVGNQVAALIPGIPVRPGQEPAVAAFYKQSVPPLLRLVTGLCEGADTLAVRAFDDLQIVPECSVGNTTAGKCIEKEIAAVLAFDVPAYRASRRLDFRAEFDQLAKRCAYIVVADGQYDKPDPDTDLARFRRRRAYRAQSALLLRQVDILVAAADPRDDGKAGGTLETINAARTFDLPVVFINIGDGSVRVIEPWEDIHTALEDPFPQDRQLEERLADLVTWVIADPDLGRNSKPGEIQSHAPGLEVLKEYFDQDGVPPTSPAGERSMTIREQVWNAIYHLFSTGPELKEDTPLETYERFRDRAKGLNYHYSGLYRGAFILNYVLAVFAVALAVSGLTLLAVFGDHSPSWLDWSLGGLGLVKLCILLFIATNTGQANRCNWNAQAVDYRYLAERLRSMFYLPRIGSFQPPEAARPYHSARAKRQSAVDWLFEAILRSISPSEIARSAVYPGHDGREIEIPVLRLDAKAALALIREPWLSGQIAYHRRSDPTHTAMDRRSERFGSIINSLVVWIVELDLMIIALWLATAGLNLLEPLPESLSHWLESVTHRLHSGTPWLIFLTAILPAAVASINGLRFQSEAGRLAERSDVLGSILGEHARDASRLAARIDAARANSETDPGAWSLEVLNLADRIAEDCVREVAEWSVLYAKELPET